MMDDTRVFNQAVELVYANDINLIKREVHWRNARRVKRNSAIMSSLGALDTIDGRAHAYSTNQSKDIVGTQRP